MKTLLLLTLLIPTQALAELPGWTDKVSEYLDPTAAVTGIIVIVFEMIFRLLKTDKPRSFLRLFSAWTGKLAGWLLSLASLLDKIVPDRTK